MKITSLLLFISCLQVSAAGNAQKVSLSVKEERLEKVFSEIKRQTGYSFFYTDDQMVNAKPVTVQVREASMDEVLELCFINQPFYYAIVDKVVVIRERRLDLEGDELSFRDSIDVRGRLINERGEPAIATIQVKGSSKITTSNEKGEFIIKKISEDAVIVISGIGIEQTEIAISGRNDLGYLKLKTAVKTLDEAIVQAYGYTSKRMMVGNIVKVNGEDIREQHVSNPLASLHGRVTGLIINQANGVPGSGVKIQIRGKNSLVQGSEPLFVIDGVPFASGNEPISSLTSSIGGLNAFNFINSNDIESIEVLKDADATAIYGSRGANGVILITTKKGRAGKTVIDGSFTTGWGKAGNLVKMMNTSEYLKMRREAFSNDGILPSNSNAPDLLLWDTTRYTDFQKLLVGDVSRKNNANISIAGGSESTSFRISGLYHNENTVFRQSGEFRKTAISGGLNHKFYQDRIKLGLNFSYTNSKNTVPTTDLSGTVNLPPNLPSLYDSTGKLKWQENGINYTNPLAYLLRTYEGTTDNILTHSDIQIKISEPFLLQISGGFNLINLNEITLSPRAAVNPAFSTLGRASYGENEMMSWSFEPQLKFAKQINGFSLNTILGFSSQHQERNAYILNASGFSSDALLRNRQAAANITIGNTVDNIYKYAGFFGRAGLDWRKTFFINISGRRDGSSRFGPEQQWGNFGSVGAAWIFSNLKYFQNSPKGISFGKVRFNYGITGNDQIPDYAFIDTWSSASYSYNGSSGLFPTRLLNPDLAWERNNKLEAGIDLGFIRDKVLLSLSWYSNRSSNQLVAYPLPIQSGFTSILQNFPALIENSGLEMEVKGEVLKNDKYSLVFTLNSSVPQNKLISYPDLENSTYANKYIIGKPISLINTYNYLGIDPQNGNFIFQDVNNDGNISSKFDYRYGGSLLPSFFGGFGSDFRYKDLGVEFFFEWRKQKGLNYLSVISNLPPGLMVNQPVNVLERWTKPGDISSLPAYTVSSSSSTYKGWSTFGISDGVYSDASYIRLKNVYGYWDLPKNAIEKISMSNVRLFVQAHNLLTITKYGPGDPETQSLYSLPPLRSYSAGLLFTTK